MTPNIFESIGNFFDSYGDGYHSRSVGMLEYSSNEIIEKLKSSFKQEPIVVEETGEEKYTIGTNGLHRYTVLRALYLSEVAKAKGDKSKLDELRQKYEIPVDLREVDKVKSYSNFLLTEYAQNVKSMTSELDDNNYYTGNVIITNRDGDKKY